MRYVRFLKPPRVVNDKSRQGPHVTCLITVTSDLGDSFLPCNLTLSAELIQDGCVRAWKTVPWVQGMRSLPVALPLSRKYAQCGPLVVRIGTEPKSDSDDFDRMLLSDSSGVVSIWSAPFNLPPGWPISSNVERRFRVGNNVHSIFEETGESIARHVWDAGVALSCQLPDLLKDSGIITQSLVKARETRRNDDSLQPLGSNESPLHVIELGSGCGMVGIVLSHLIPSVKVVLTDLAEARAIAVQNIESSGRHRTNRAVVAFNELDWDLPSFHGDASPFELFQGSSPTRVDLVVAADCTYNADSSLAFVKTIHGIASEHPNVVIAVAMKRRHSSEDIFFDHMSTAGFKIRTEVHFPLPSDIDIAEEVVELYIFQK